MFVRNAWYVAAWPHEIGRELFARRICDEPLCFFRTEAGEPVALLDRCPHRMAPLSIGRRCGDAIECLYHGITFDAHGRCVRIPGQDEVRNAASARTFPLVEKWGWVWVWMGDPRRADPALIPDAHWLTEPDWCPAGGLMHFRSHYQLLTDNLLDLSHEAFTHRGTIGNAAVAETPIRVSGSGDTVRVERFMENCAAPPLFQRVCGFSTNVDRTQIIEFTPPSYIVIDARAFPSGAGDGARAGLEWRVLNAITPETASSCHYFWAVPRHFAQDDPAITRIVQEQIEKTFREDQIVLEAQQQALAETSLEERTVFTAFDAGATRARRIVDRLLAEEREEAVASTR